MRKKTAACIQKRVQWALSFFTWYSIDPSRNIDRIEKIYFKFPVKKLIFNIEGNFFIPINFQIPQ